MKGRTIIRRGKITYYISDNSVVVGIDSNQFISYNIYNSPSRSSLAEFKKILIASKINEYGTAIEQMDLASRCELVGSGTKKPDWEE